MNQLTDEQEYSENPNLKYTCPQCGGKWKAREDAELCHGLKVCTRESDCQATSHYGNCKSMPSTPVYHQEDVDRAATAMRDKCVADLDQQRNRMLHLYQQIFTMKSTGDPQHPLQACIDYDAKVAFEEALESLTLDQVKPGEM